MRQNGWSFSQIIEEIDISETDSLKAGRVAARSVKQHRIVTTGVI